jgi:hypothetical protein
MCLHFDPQVSACVRKKCGRPHLVRIILSASDPHPQDHHQPTKQHGEHRGTKWCNLLMAAQEAAEAFSFAIIRAGVHPVLIHKLTLQDYSMGQTQRQKDTTRSMIVRGGDPLAQQ